MMMIAIPSRFCRSSSRARIWAWTVTSSAVVGSTGIGDSHQIEQLDGASARHGLRDLLVDEHRFHQLRTDPVERMQRRQRILEDHCDVVAADLTHLIVLERDQVTPLELHPPLDPGALLPGQPQRGERRDAFARSRPPPDPQRLPASIEY